MRSSTNSTPSSTEQPRPSGKSRWLRPQFGLRALLGLVVVVAIVATWYGMQLRHRQRTVTIVFVDAETGQPVTKVDYNYSIATSQGSLVGMDWDEWVHHASSTGILEVDAPPSCEISIGARVEGYLEGYGETYGTFTITADDADRRIVFKMHPGVTVLGTVLNDDKQPVAGAVVSPLIFTPPLFTEDTDRSVTSDARGRFELHGVDDTLGIHFAHADYLETKEYFDGKVKRDAKGRCVVTITLAAGRILSGTIADPAGRPLAGVKISDGAGKRVTSAADGSFVMKSPAKWNESGYYLTCEKVGFVETTLRGIQATAEPLAIILEPLYDLRGRVVSPENHLIRKFDVIAGPGRNPAGFECEEATAINAKGEFQLKLEETGTHWVSVRTAGFAVWEGWTEVARDAEPLTIELSTGVTVRGTVQLPHGRKAQGPVHVSITPQREDGHEFLVSETPARNFASRSVQLAKAGTFAIPNVRPDKYTLRIDGNGITPLEKKIEIHSADVDVGDTQVQGVGRVVGTINRPKDEGGGAWEFADGEVSHELLPDPITFNADERGNFVIENVPAGEVTISFSYMVSADIIDAHSKAITVVEGRTTSLKFFEN